MKNFLYECNQWLRDKTRPVRDFFGWVSKVYDYALFLWPDRDWDYYHILRTLRFKLERVRTEIIEADRHSDALRTAAQIRLCTNLLQRLMDNAYSEVLHENLEAKYGETIFVRLPEGHFTMKRANVHTDADEERYRKDIKECFNHELYMQKQDMELFCSKFSKYIRGWWD